MNPTLHSHTLGSLPLLARGKVRDNYAVGDDRILMVASDRISAFDVVIEVTRLRDGRIRALRIGEFRPDVSAGLVVSDIFRFAVSRVAAGGAVEGSFIPSGHTPRVAGQLQALGMRVDSSLFVRGR